MPESDVPADINAPPPPAAPAPHHRHPFSFSAINASHNSPYPAVEWVHGWRPLLVFDLPQYAEHHLEELSEKPAFATASEGDHLGWAQDYVAKAHLTQDPHQLAKAMTVAQDEAILGAMPRSLSFFNHMTFWGTIALLLMSLVLLVFARRRPDQYKPTGTIQHLLEMIVLFVRDDIVRPNMPHPEYWTPYFASLFLTIMTLNVFGIVPFFANPNANLAVTGAFALVTLVLMLFLGLRENGPVHFWFNIIPVKWTWKPMDMFVYILLMVLEWLSLLTRPVILAIRLFANMLAGHTVLLVFLSLGFIIHEAHGNTVMAHSLGIVGWVIAIAFYVLELVVALIQAYIFTLLSAIFIGQCAHPEH